MNVYHWFDFTIIGLDNYVKALFVLTRVSSRRS